MPIPGSNIRLLRRERPLTLQALADAVGMTISNLSRLERGEQDTSRENVEKIAKTLGVSVSVLYSENALVEAAVLRMRKAPLLTAAQLMEWTGPDGEDFPDTHPYLYLDLERASRNVFAYRVQESANEPYLQAGDDLIFDAFKQPRWGDFVIAQDPNGRVILGRLREPQERTETGADFEIVPNDRLHPIVTAERVPGLRLRGTLVEIHRYFS
jgi:transcriptional regulator with XRE-family HTH domain